MAELEPVASTYPSERSAKVAAHFGDRGGEGAEVLTVLVICEEGVWTLRDPARLAKEDLSAGAREWQGRRRQNKSGQPCPQLGGVAAEWSTVPVGVTVAPCVPALPIISGGCILLHSDRKA